MVVRQVGETGIEKELYDYQLKDLDTIFKRIGEVAGNYNMLYQLPTGGGKTVIFSEIARRFIENTGKKVLVLTHRIELSVQTSRMLNGFRVHNKVINSKVKELPDQDQYMCFVAMVETLANRLQDRKFEMKNIGLVIVDEAHYNSFRKLFRYFDNSMILGVTATPLSSNIKLPMKDHYEELIVGESIASLIKKGFLATPEAFTFDVGLQSLQIGSNGDYTVKSSEEVYTADGMQAKLINAYEEKAMGAKTLIFNNGINTSLFVYDTFRRAGHPVRHLDNTHTEKERKEILHWFKHTPDAVLTSVSILTTGFDEPTVETVILNRATRSLTLYFQMIGRGSRVLPEKKNFRIIDLGNNIARFGAWEAPIDWQEIFYHPDYYLENIRTDEEIERHFIFEMSPEVRAKFPNTDTIDFDIKTAYKKAVTQGRPPKTALKESIKQHAAMCCENANSATEARMLALLLKEDIAYRVRQYTHLIMNSTKNYRNWLEEDYLRKLRLQIVQHFSGVTHT